MSELSESVKKHMNDHIICSCGKKCYLDIHIACHMYISVSAKCYNCNKGLRLTENVVCIDEANFDLLDHLVEDFAKRFNRVEDEGV